ncbi:MAG: hypothetical protein COA73_14845 [Candidatus Hydrogenedentota bacterium]|nr:MAG: hypothetical protein COA73_14845 [Candidatus Hydrogenedentota bacterium]
MISRSQTQIFDTVLVKQTTKAGGFLNGWITILPGEYIAKHLDGKWTYFLADTVLWNNGVVGDSPVQGGVRVSRESGEIQLFATPTAGPRAHAKFDSNPGFDFVEKPFLSRGGYLEELIYAGKTTGALSLNYRKTWGENSINPELQVISFNIEKDKFLEYKGARIEVIDYNSNRIQYKVYRNFSKQIN